MSTGVDGMRLGFGRGRSLGLIIEVKGDCWNLSDGGITRSVLFSKAPYEIM